MMHNRYHPAEHMHGLRELSEITEPAAVVIRPDGSIDAYGPVGVVDQRKDPDSDHTVLHQHGGYAPHSHEIRPDHLGVSRQSA